MCLAHCWFYAQQYLRVWADFLRDISSWTCTQEGKFKQQRGISLNLLVKIENNQFFIQLYDNGDEFPFSKVGMPYLRSNITSKMYYPTYGSEILRTARATSCKLVQRKNSNDNNVNKVKELKYYLKTLVKSFGSYYQIFQKTLPNFLQFHAVINYVITTWQNFVYI